MKIGDRYLFIADDFDGHTEIKATVTEASDDHAILTADDGMTLYYERGFNDELFKQI